MPPNLIDELKRDRRWCQGNLINFRLSWARGLHPAHRAVFITGAMAYVSAPLWFLFLLLSTLLLGIHTLVEPEYFVRPSQLFPVWPEWHPDRGISLYVATTVLLFLPKILGVLLISTQDAREFGGRLRLAASMLAEMLFSALLAPIRMLFHTQFVVSAIFGWALQWKSPPREDAETSWGEALRHHGLHTLLGLAWAGVVYWLNPAFLWWLLPVVGALVVSVPLSVYSSRVWLGRALRRAGFFLIPEELRPPQELRRTKQAVEQAPASPGFVDAVVDPITNALACACRAARWRRVPGIDPWRQQLLDRALTQGPDALDTKQRGLLLRDQLTLCELHFKVWTSPAVHSRWIDAQLHPTRRVEVVRAEVHVLAPATKGDAAAADSVPLPGVTAQFPSLLG
jgi:membrane glycosyltransferase